MNKLSKKNVEDIKDLEGKKVLVIDKRNHLGGNIYN